MATILKGAPVVAAMNERNALLCEQLKAKGITPTLAVVRVGEREDDLSYERGVMTRCGKVGVAVRQFVLPADATQEQLLRVLDEVNTDDSIHGCLLFRPLPKQNAVDIWMKNGAARLIFINFIWNSCVKNSSCKSNTSPI